MSHPNPTQFAIELLLAMAIKLPRVEEIRSSIQEIEALTEETPISIGSVLEENAVKYKDHPAIFFEEISYTHFEFNALVNQYAYYFLSKGMKKGTVVAVFLENRLTTVILIAALAKLGAVASLINANQRGKVLTHSIKTDQGKYYIVGEERINAFEEVRANLGLTDDRVLFGVKNKGDKNLPSDYLPLVDLVQNCSTTNPSTTKDVVLGDRFANVFTSGTTGMPKASKQTHRRWYGCYLWYGKINMNIRQEDVFYVPIPFFHTNALIVAWPAAAAGGAAMAIRRKLSISNFWKDVKKYNVSAFIYIGEICRYLMNKPSAPFDTQHRIRKIVGNGLRPDIWKAFKKRFNIPEVYELYGASDGILGFTNVFNVDCTIGTCLVEYAIVKYDVENDTIIRNEQGLMEPVSVGEAGLLVGKFTEKTHFPGYVNKSKNREKILENVLEHGDKWFNTGDLIRDIGNRHAQFVDRLGDTFRWKGENVSTAELEAIMNNLPEVSHSAVYGVALPQIDGRAGMASIKSPIPLEEFDFHSFTQTLRKQLPPYAIPLFIRFVTEFEKTATHKIKKSVLKKEGIESNGDPIYVLLPKAEAFVLMTEEISEKIRCGSIAF